MCAGDCCRLDRTARTKFGTIYFWSEAVFEHFLANNFRKKCHWKIPLYHFIMKILFSIILIKVLYKFLSNFYNFLISQVCFYWYWYFIFLSPGQHGGDAAHFPSSRDVGSPCDVSFRSNAGCPLVAPLQMAIR